MAVLWWLESMVHPLESLSSQVRVLKPHAEPSPIAALPDVTVIHVDPSNAATCLSHQHVAHGCCAVISVLHEPCTLQPAQLHKARQ